ncbi:MAG: hypothetical protein JNL96_24960 [Planctomycetaceae bacterium]|nr:hypothetical protein [Planctomycetaceae bacterium]
MMLDIAGMVRQKKQRPRMILASAAYHMQGMRHHSKCRGFPQGERTPKATFGLKGEPLIEFRRRAGDDPRHGSNLPKSVENE